MQQRKSRTGKCFTYGTTQTLKRMCARDVRHPCRGSARSWPKTEPIPGGDKTDTQRRNRRSRAAFAQIIANHIFRHNVPRKICTTVAQTKKTYYLCTAKEKTAKFLHLQKRGRPIRLSARTQDFHSWKRSSILLWATERQQSCRLDTGRLFFSKKECDKFVYMKYWTYLCTRYRIKAHSSIG